MCAFKHIWICIFTLLQLCLNAFVSACEHKWVFRFANKFRLHMITKAFSCKHNLSHSKEYCSSDQGWSQLLFVGLKVTLNRCAHAHSTCHEYHYSCIAGNGNGVSGSVVFWCSKICEQRQQANYFFMLGKLYDHWRRAWDYKPAWNAVCL